MDLAVRRPFTAKKMSDKPTESPHLQREWCPVDVRPQWDTHNQFYPAGPRLLWTWFTSRPVQTCCRKERFTRREYAPDSVGVQLSPLRMQMRGCGQTQTGSQVGWPMITVSLGPGAFRAGGRANTGEVLDKGGKLVTLGWQWQLILHGGPSSHQEV